MLSYANIYRKALPVLVLAGAAMAMYSQPVLAQAAGNVKCNGCVGAKDIKNNAVKASKIRSSAVTNAKLGNSSVTGTKIQDGTVVENDLSAAVRAKLNTPGPAGPAGPAGPVGPSGPPGPNSVGSAEIIDGSIQAVDIAPGVITGGGGGGIGASGSVTIDDAEFQPARPGPSGQDNHLISITPFLPGDTGQYTRPINIGQRLCLAAPVQLPDGVTITSFEMVLRDNTLFDFQFALWRTDIDPVLGGDTGTELVGLVTTSSQSPAKRIFVDPVIPAAVAVVDADHYAYTIASVDNNLPLAGCLRYGPAGVTSGNLFAAVVRY